MDQRANRARTIPPQTPLLVPPEIVASPRLTALAVALATEGDTALTAFWDEVRDVGTPLIEPIADDPGNCVVTFLW